MTDHYRARLERREWTVTLEAVTPPPDDVERRARILTLAEAMRTEDRVAALTLTDRTTAGDADPLSLAAEVTARSGKHTVVHVAGKARTRPQIERTLRRAVDAGVASVLLTGGDRMPGVVRVDALDMLTLARDSAPTLFRTAVLDPGPGERVDEATRHAFVKRAAGAEAFMAQVTWELAQRETVAACQRQLGVPVLGAVLMLTRHTLDFLDRHELLGLAVPRTVRDRVARQDAGAGALRLALDVAVLRRLGYAGAHISGVVAPRLVALVLDEADRLHATLGDDWRDVWRRAVGIA